MLEGNSAIKERPGGGYGDQECWGWEGIGWSVWVGLFVTGELSLEGGEGVSCVELSRQKEQPGQSF